MTTCCLSSLARSSTYLRRRCGGVEAVAAERRRRRGGTLRARGGGGHVHLDRDGAAAASAAKGLVEDLGELIGRIERPCGQHHHERHEVRVHEINEDDRQRGEEEEEESRGEGGVRGWRRHARDEVEGRARALPTRATKRPSGAK